MNPKGTGKVTYREDNDEQEIDIGDVVKLEPQILGYETDGGVLCGANLVSHELSDGVSFFVACILR